MLGDMSRVAAAEWRQQSDRQSGTRFHGWVLNRGRRPGVTYPELFILLVREGKWQVGGALLKLKPGLAVFKTDTECLFSKCLGNRLMFWIKVQVLDYWSGLMTVWNLWGSSALRQVRVVLSWQAVFNWTGTIKQFTSCNIMSRMSVMDQSWTNHWRTNIVFCRFYNWTLHLFHDIFFPVHCFSKTLKQQKVWLFFLLLVCWLKCFYFSKGQNNYGFSRKMKCKTNVVSTCPGLNEASFL